MDEVDRAQRHSEVELEAAIAAARGVEIPVGVPGECDLCGEWTGRLVEGLCAPCRDWQATRSRRRIR
jgi:hypothetical protein